MSRKLLGRYAPVLAILVLQLLLVTVGSPGDTITESVASGGAVPSGFDAAGAALPSDASGGGAQATPSGGGAVGGAVASGSAPASGSGTKSQTAARGPGAAAGGGTQAVAAASEGAAQKVDQLGRPLEGDKSKCAPGGLLQDNITFAPPPCMPKFVGDNGGATYQGITKDTIKVVIFFPDYGEALNAALGANGLQMTPQQAKETDALSAEFMNRHYEMYGRRLEVIEHFAPTGDAANQRSLAKAIVEKHKPFAVFWYVQGIMPPAFADQLAQLKVLAFGPGEISDDLYIRNAPYIWTQAVQGYRLADMAADYYCKRMWGKNATLAGDPTMRLRKRKFAIVTTEEETSLTVGRRLMSQVTGGMCGSPADGTTHYTYSGDSATAQGQQSTLMARMKNDGITTMYGLVANPTADQQQFYPENFIATAVDDDFVGRFGAAVGSPTQMQNTFGIGFYVKGQPIPQHEFYRAIKSVNPQYDPPLLAEAPFNGLHFFARIIQFAGPRLTPQTFLAGARSIPQTGGWVHTNPFPGWKCCNPYVAMYHTGVSDTSFSAKTDARQIYYDPSAISPSDNQPGAWVSPDDSRRYTVGSWTKGEPKQP